MRSSGSKGHLSARLQPRHVPSTSGRERELEVLVRRPPGKGNATGTTARSAPGRAPSAGAVGAIRVAPGVGGGSLVQSRRNSLQTEGAHVVSRLELLMWACDALRWLEQPAHRQKACGWAAAARGAGGEDAAANRTGRSTGVPGRLGA